MASTKSMQQDTMATLDTAKALVDKIVAIMEIFNYSPSLSFNFATNPIGFLLQLLKHVGVTYEDIRVWLTNFLIFVLPALEISVKAILLTNLKNLVSCSIDPRIPEKYRKRHKAPQNPNTDQEYGIDIAIETIDFLDKLSINPLSDEGKEWYFGLEGVEDVYKFARADDFDAFLWFVIHRGSFPNSAQINVNGDTFNDNIHGEGNYRVEPFEGTLLEPLKISPITEMASSILPGNTFTYTGSSHVISMCIDKYEVKTDETHKNQVCTLVPVSDDWNSVNWYIRRASQLWKNLGVGWKTIRPLKNEEGRTTGSTQSATYKQRKFEKERAICNLQYIDQASASSSLLGLVNNKLRFTILPRPFIHIPNLSEGEPPWRFQKLLFDAKGNYDPNGKYTILAGEDNTLTSFTYSNTNITIGKDGDVTVENPNELVKGLVECYPGLTVYEFNYDYVMGMKLFDAKVLATTLLDALVNTRVGINFRLDRKHQDATERIKQIVKNLINVDDSEVKDCFYTFDNSKYERLLRAAEEKRARRQSFGNTTTEIGGFNSVREILDEYDANADLQEQVSVINRAITQASVTISEGVEEKDKYSVEFAFVTDLIENLTIAITTGLLSPKVMMLLEVNKTIMGGTWQAFSPEDFFKALESIIISSVKEIRDLIIQELLKLLMKVIDPLIQMLTTLVISEQTESYAAAIRRLIEDCPLISFGFGNKLEEVKLDTVDYADIDVSTTKQGEQPDKQC